jgi:hypothetical protein
MVETTLDAPWVESSILAGIYPAGLVSTFFPNTNANASAKKTFAKLIEEKIQ